MSKLEFYEVVKVVQSGKLFGGVGVVVGISEDDEKVHGYGVFINGFNHFFLREEISPTGTQITKEDWEAGRIPSSGLIDG